MRIWRTVNQNPVPKERRQTGMRPPARPPPRPLAPRLSAGHFQKPVNHFRKQSHCPQGLLRPALHLRPLSPLSGIPHLPRPRKSGLRVLPPPGQKAFPDPQASPPVQAVLSAQAYLLPLLHSRPQPPGRPVSQASPLPRHPSSPRQAPVSLPRHPASARVPAQWIPLPLCSPAGSAVPAHRRYSPEAVPRKAPVWLIEYPLKIFYLLSLLSPPYSWHVLITLTRLYLFVAEDSSSRLNSFCNQHIMLQAQSQPIGQGQMKVPPNHLI